MFEGMKNIFMVGIEGSGMRGLAYLFAKQGFDVAGEDDTAAERREIDGYTIVPQADAAAAVRAADVLVYSDAVRSDHQLRILAEEQGIKQMPYQEALGVFAKQYTTLAVTGTHGKSSTTAMLAHILVEAGYDPTVLVGASLDVFGGRNARAGKGEYFVVEADEYRRHFLALEPTHIIITSIDFDHPDYFTSLEDVELAYSEFISRLADDGSVVVLSDVVKEHSDVKWPTQTVRVGVEAGRDIVMALPGKHMQQNASLAVALTEILGIDKVQASLSLTTFSGLKRRMENIGVIGAVPVYSDYGHHPQEIEATLAGAKDFFVGKKIGVLVEPHMIERLVTFFEGFSRSLEAADAIMLCPVFYPKGREGEISDAPGKLLADLQGKGKTATLLDSYDNLLAALQKFAQQVDVIIAFTAGHLDANLREQFKNATPPNLPLSGEEPGRYQV